MPGKTAPDARTPASRSAGTAGRDSAAGKEDTTEIMPLFRDVTPRTRRSEMPRKRSEVVAQRIVRMIREDGLRTGDALPIEADMNESFGVGRSTVREALRILEQQGVINIRPGRGGGPTVGLPDSRQLASTLALLMQFSDTPFRSVLEVREYIEPIAAALCARNGNQRVLDGIRQSVEAMRAGLADEELFLYENHRFHELVAEGSGNPLLTYFLNSLDWIIDGARLGVVYSRTSRKHVAEIHEQICEAIEDCDSDRARDVMSQHMAETRAFFERKFPKVMDQALTWEMYGS
ncbi:FadR/GntR family transcriptional regulator [Nocardia sp. 852002-20019_SCH5090214]|uniref:FadR/GntR family transcriptional regulator n=2 Tax=Nocardia TaxID=1817 RepID=UPI0009EF05D4